MVLVLTVKVDEAVLIGDDVAVVVLGAGRVGVRLGVRAPPGVRVDRECVRKAREEARRGIDAGAFAPDVEAPGGGEA